MDDIKLSRGKTLSFEPDQDSESPRAWDGNLGTIVGDHRRYEVFDKKASSIEDVCLVMLHALIGTSSYKGAAASYEKLRSKEDCVRFMDKYTFWLPVYMYDHSGQTIATTPFSCPWDSGQIGYIFVTKEKYKREYSAKILTKKQGARARWILENEIITFDTYIRGAVYGVVLKDKDDNVLESCWGFYGDNILLSGALDCAAEWVSKEDVKRIKREVPRYDRVEYRTYRNWCSYFYPKKAVTGGRS